MVKEIQKTAKQKDFPTMGDFLRLPDIFTIENESDDVKLKAVFIDALQSALKEMDNIRIEEGKIVK